MISSILKWSAMSVIAGALWVGSTLFVLTSQAAIDAFSGLATSVLGRATVPAQLASDAATAKKDAAKARGQAARQRGEIKRTAGRVNSRSKRMVARNVTDAAASATVVGGVVTVVLATADIYDLCANVDDMHQLQVNVGIAEPEDMSAGQAFCVTTIEAIESASEETVSIWGLMKAKVSTWWEDR